jgi:hypothetical protein
MGETTPKAAARQRKPRPKPRRDAELIAAPTNLLSGVLRITIGKTNSYYVLRPLPGGFEVERVGFDADGTTYRVIILGGNVATPGCSCPGHTRWGHCKHFAELSKMVADGRLAAGGAA